MKCFIFLICYFLSSLGQQHEEQATFPDDFMFGAASSAHQSEGAWNVDGKGLSMWDVFVTNPDAIADNSNAHVACNSYYNYKRDIEMLKELGVQVYRFSISWTRILPNGRTDYVNPTGIAHYNELIDELVANNIVPFVTMYHWDLPQSLSEQGGWLSEDIVDWFGDYARVLYENFGDRVKHWLTINEPYIHCFLGYGIAKHAPGIKSPGLGFYDCSRNILLANARAYHIYDEFRATQQGKVGIVLSMDWLEPLTESQDDADAVVSAFSLMLRQYADPIFSAEGNYPQLLIDQVTAASADEGYSSSRLRPLNEEQIAYIKGTSDFFALNTYSTTLIYRNDSLDELYEIPSMLRDAYFGEIPSPFVPSNGSTDLRGYSPGFYNLLMYITNEYNKPAIYITENGYALNELVDNTRVQYIRSYLSSLLAAKRDGADVRAYVVWNLMDDFQWDSGYTVKMGLYETNMSDPNRTRTPRKSALVYKEIIRSKMIDFDYEPPEDNGSYLSKPSLAILVILIFYFMFLYWYVW